MGLVQSCQSLLLPNASLFTMLPNSTISREDGAFYLGLSVVAATSLFIYSKAKVALTPGKRVNIAPKVQNNDWISEAAYLQLATIVDSFLPSLSVNEASDEVIMSALKKLGLDDTIDNMPLTVKDLSKHRSYLCAGALDYGTHRHCVETIGKVLSVEERNKVSSILNVLSTSAGSLVLTGYAVPFSELPLSLREKVLFTWRDSSLAPIRSLFQLFKRLVSVHYIACLNDANDPKTDNPGWEGMGYRPDSSRQNVTFTAKDDDNDRILRSQINLEAVLKALGSFRNGQGEHEMRVDAVVVGSGCGGGVVAHNLVQAGHTVLVLDKSGYYNQREFSKWREIEALEKTFDKSGCLSSEDANFAIFAGSCVGGGSLINWSASFATPVHVLEDWTNAGMAQFDPSNPESEYAKAMREVHRLFNINTDNSYHEHECHTSNSSCTQTAAALEAAAACKETFKVNENNRLLWKTAEKGGFVPEKIPRNVKDCVDCGHCCYGCPHGKKQSTIHALMEPVLLQQGRESATAEKKVGKLYILPFCFADKVLTHVDNQGKRKAVGVLATATSQLAERAEYKLRIHAKITAVCAGSVQTPAFLLRSQMKHRGIGRGLTLHPVVPVCAVMTKDVDTGLSNGVGMGVVVREPKIFNPQTGSPRHPVALETPPGHPAIISTVMPWHGALLFKIMMLKYRQSAAFLGISRDISQPINRVEIDAQGFPVVHYHMTKHDSDLVMAGIEACLRLLYSDPRVGIILVSHANQSPFVRHKNESSQDEKMRFEAYVQSVKRDGIQPMRTQMYSAHQMSSVRMAATEAAGPVNTQGELYECENLFVADGSVLPTSLGINPMVTIESFAQMISHHMVQRLERLNH